MASVLDIIDISSDEEDFGREKIIDFSTNFFDDIMDDQVLVLDLTVEEQKKDDSDDDCLVLESNPHNLVALVDNNHGGDESDELLIVGEKGQLACRDYPHPRHLCVNFPFSTTSHERHCKMCHCYVCDSPAPCIYWTNHVIDSGHCHAMDEEGKWKVLRKAHRENKVDPELQNLSTPLHPPGPILQCSKSTTLQPCPSTRISIRNSPTQIIKGRPRDAISHCQRRTRQILIPEMQYMHKETYCSGASASASARTMQPHAKLRRVGTNGDCLTSINKQACAVAPKTMSSQCLPQVTQMEDNSKSWQDILKSVAAELGVSDSNFE